MKVLNIEALGHIAGGLTLTGWAPAPILQAQAEAWKPQPAPNPHPWAAPAISLHHASLYGILTKLRLK